MLSLPEPLPHEATDAYIARVSAALVAWSSVEPGRSLSRLKWRPTVALPVLIFAVIFAVFMAVPLVWPTALLWVGIVGLASLFILWVILSLSGHKFRHPPVGGGTGMNWKGELDDTP